MARPTGESGTQMAHIEIHASRYARAPRRGLLYVLSGPGVFVFTDMSALAALALISCLALPEGANAGAHLLITGGLAAAGLVWLRGKGHYRVRQSPSNQVRPLLQLSVTGFLAASATFAALEHPGMVPASALMWAPAALVLLGLRLAARAALNAAGSWMEPVAVIAPRGRWEAAGRLLDFNAGHGLQAERFADLDELAGLESDALAARLDALGPRTLFLTADEPGQPAAARLASWLGARGRSFYYQPALGQVSGASLDVIDYPPAEGLVMRIGDPLDRPAGSAVKRAADLCGAALALVLLSPLMALLAVLTRADGGPALYVQTRIGRDGRTFGCLKFRSMAVDAGARLRALLDADPVKAAEWNAYQKLTDDPRITPVGRIIRRLNLDELPQLVNVLRGEMSLVGPRPMTPEQKPVYGEAIHAYERMRPGITGMWQVNGRNATTFAERARLDAWYARNWSLWRDAVILARTVLEVVRPTGL
jgi:Undecaprenyl-phosphate galactose phosphotransferase WbaP